MVTKIIAVALIIDMIGILLLICFMNMNNEFGWKISDILEKTMYGFHSPISCAIFTFVSGYVTIYAVIVGFARRLISKLRGLLHDTESTD